MVDVPAHGRHPLAATAACRALGVAALLLTLAPNALRAQSTGSVLGRVVNAETGEPVPGAAVRALDTSRGTLTADNGRFVLVAVPVGEHDLRIELIGYRPVTLAGVRVRAGSSARVSVELEPAAVEVEGVVVEGQRLQLIEPQVNVSHEVVLGRELRDLPIDAVEEAIELVPGVSDGHIRGGRIGQEVYVVDGLAVKNQFEASTQGLGLEFSPSALEEIDVTTGGFGAEHGSALSGVIRFVTRRGDPVAWQGRAALLTDHWAPSSLYRGFTGLSMSAGGPLPFAGDGTTLFVDVLAQGMYDTDPRGRGLTCVRESDTEEDLLAEEIDALDGPRGTPHLYCPYTTSIMPHQQGDKLIGFVRLDRPLAEGLTLTASLLHNRNQRELYTPEFKYNRDSQLGRRTRGDLLTVALDWTRHARGRAYHVTARGAAMQLDRHLGALDLHAARDRAGVAGFGLGSYEFMGEDFVRRPVGEQLASGIAVPGYERPGGSTGSPFGPAAEGIFFTNGTPHIANWSRTGFLAGDLVGELVTADGHVLRAGGSTKFHRVESYERVLSHLPGSAPYYARFFPATAAGFTEVRLAAADEVVVELGLRYEAFRPGIRVEPDAPAGRTAVIETSWKHSFIPRIGVAGPVPGTDGRVAWRFNYGLVSQPPDFQYFLDTTIGDSLRTDIQRQGNPNLGFERGASYEIGLSHLLNDEIGASVTAFRKELGNLVTGALRFAGRSAGEFTTGDFGHVEGLEVAARARWREVALRAAYTLQRATGATSGSALEDSIQDERIEYPLAFDRRHSADFALFAGRAAAGLTVPWSAVLSTSVRSGYPLDRRIAAGDFVGIPEVDAYLPWTAEANLRLSYALGSLPGCARCRWRVVADGRNILGRENVLALRRDTGGLAPPLRHLTAAADDLPADYEVIPRESPRYSALIDLNADGLISEDEYRHARFAAALDRQDPSLYFDTPRLVRLGVEVTF